MAKYVEISGVTFEVMNSPIVVKCGCTIWDAYKRPSVYKENIYNEWKHFFYENGWFYGVQSYNGFQFSVAGALEYGGKMYTAYITKAHNRLYPNP